MKQSTKQFSLDQTMHLIQLYERIQTYEIMNTGLFLELFKDFNYQKFNSSAIDRVIYIYKITAIFNVNTDNSSPKIFLNKNNAFYCMKINVQDSKIKFVELNNNQSKTICDEKFPIIDLDSYLDNYLKTLEGELVFKINILNKFFNT